MTQPHLTWRTLGWPVYLALALFVLVIIVFSVALVAMQSIPAPTAEPVSAGSYSERVAALLAIAQPENAQTAIDKYGCHACHMADGTGAAPSWDGIAERAATRRPPMPAAAYLYESITNPSAYVVEGYANLMPGDFSKRMSDQELADVLAYLLTPDAH